MQYYQNIIDYIHISMNINIWWTHSTSDTNVCMLTLPRRWWSLIVTPNPLFFWSRLFFSFWILCLVDRSRRCIIFYCYYADRFSNSFFSYFLPYSSILFPSMSYKFFVSCTCTSTTLVDDYLISDVPSTSRIDLSEFLLALYLWPHVFIFR